ncbi:MAG: glutamate 5-kinase [Candidatus Methanofastidiosia archaeon]
MGNIEKVKLTPLLGLAEICLKKVVFVAGKKGIYVIKLGTSLIADVKTNEIRIETLDTLTDQISKIKKDKDVILVSSGAISLGLDALGLRKRPEEMSKKQAAAAIGQNKLMNLYEKLFKKHRITIAQVLLTKEGILTQRGYTNAKNTIFTLLDFGIIPIINENDTIATEEIQFGDNDNLSAYVAKMIDAEMLVILTDTDGLYTEDPAISPHAKKIDVVSDFTHDICRSAKSTNNPRCVGGMSSKITAAKKAVKSEIPVAIASGFKNDVILKIVMGNNIGTLFLPKKGDRKDE